MTLKKTITYVAGALILGAAGIFFIYNEKTKLKNNDFYYANLIEYTPTKKGIWPGYMNEKIKHREYNWDIYKEKVLEINELKDETDFQKLKKNIVLPDLDSDGKVGE